MKNYLIDRNRNRRSLYVAYLVAFGLLTYVTITNIVPNLVKHWGESTTIEEVVKQNGSLESIE